MKDSNPRIQVDETWSIKVVDKTDDWTRIFDLIKQGVNNFEESDVDVAFLEVVALQFANSAISDKVLLVLYRDLYPVGVLLGMNANTHPVFHKTGVTIEQLWWVDPEHRGSKHATKLIDAFEEWSRQIGVKRVVMGHFNDLIGTKVKKYYEKNGYKLLEQSYVKELK